MGDVRHPGSRERSADELIRLVVGHSAGANPAAFLQPTKRSPNNGPTSTVGPSSLQIISRAGAKAQRMKRYFSGTPCRQGHVAERLTANYRCSICMAADTRSRHARDPSWKRAARARWRQRNPARNKAERAAYRAARLQATPPWVDHSELRRIYAECPPGHHVDHIIPLKNPQVCGLHVPWNLQYLPVSDNLKKSNSFVSS